MYYLHTRIQGWNCSRVESLVWQYDISALMANQIEKQTGSKPLQVRLQQGNEPGHLYALYFTFHKPTRPRPETLNPKLSPGTGAAGQGARAPSRPFPWFYGDTPDPCLSPAVGLGPQRS
jgi:hypothetical protein